MITYYLHPDNPQERILNQIITAFTNDELIVYPSQHGYQLAMSLSAKEAHLQALRMGNYQTAPHAVLICQDLSHIAQYADIDNFAHRIMKSKLGTGIDFALAPTKLTPKKFIDDKSKTIAVRQAATAIERALVEKLGEAFVSLPIIIDGEPLSYSSSYEVEMAVENLVDGYINSVEIMQSEPTLVNLTDGTVTVLSQGDAQIDF